MTLQAHNPARAARSHGAPGRRFAALTLAILVVAAAWRAALAVQMPALARDGVTFCWYAKSLGEQGLACFDDPAAQQHPLYPLLILAAQRIAVTLGAPPSPWTWQICGQFVAGLAGLVVIGLAGWVTAQLVRKLELPLDARHAALLAMLLAAFLPLNLWLSADVMSDQVHLAFYLGAVGCLPSLLRRRTAFTCGLLAGLAFLTRQEGIVPLGAGWVALLLDRGRPPRARLGSAAALTLAFLLLAAPYWALVGGFSQKKDPAEWFLHDADEGAVQAALDTPAGSAGASDRWPENAGIFAKLELLDVRWYALVPYALYELFHAGRVVVPLLALLPIVNLRRRLLRPPLAGFTACFLGHFLLTNVLLYHYQYLSTRHMLVPVMLLVPFAALLLARLQALAFQLRRRGLAWIAVGVPLLPLMVYGLRVPNAEDGFLVDAARWLRAHDARIREKRLVSGSSGRRIAFYAEMGWVPWYERPEEFDELMSTLAAAGPGYLVIEVGTGFERAGNDALVGRLRSAPAATARVEPLAILPGPDEENKLHVFTVRSRDEAPGVQAESPATRETTPTAAPP